MVQQVGDDVKVRLAIDPNNIKLHPVMGEVWKIRMDKKIVVDFLLCAPTFLSGTKVILDFSLLIIITAASCEAFPIFRPLV